MFQSPRKRKYSGPKHPGLGSSPGPQLHSPRPILNRLFGPNAISMTPPARPALKSISSISDKELLFIFGQLPLWDLVSVGSVCHRWRWISLKRYSKRKSLKLIQAPEYRAELADMTRYWFFTGFSDKFPFERDCYRVTRPITRERVKWFKRKLPNVTELALYGVDHLSLDMFLELINFYPNLTRLILFCSRDKQLDYNCPSFWIAISTLKFLDHLYLPFDLNTSESRDLLIQSIPANHPNLQSICIKDIFRGLPDSAWPRTMDYIGKLHKHLDLNENPVMVFVYKEPPPRKVPGRTRSSIGEIKEEDESVKWVITRIGLYTGMDFENPDDPDNENFNYFNLNAYDISNQIIDNLLEHVLNHHSTLTHLDLYIPGETKIYFLLPSLSTLTHLTHLRLITEQHRFNNSDNLFFPPLTSDNYQDKLSTSSIKSVHNLTLSHFQVDPSAGIFLYFPAIFPQVRVLNFEDCYFENQINGKRCSALWLAKNFIRFPELTRVCHNSRLVVQLDRDNRDSMKVMRRIVEDMYVKRI